MRISEEIIEQVRSSNDIIDVIASYVRLKKRGKNFIGLCPFHQEKTPSFTVSADKQMYHCFGCQKGGNVFTFVMDHDKVAFGEAVRILAARVGIVIDEGPQTESHTEQESLYDACRLAGQVFYENLTKTDEGRGALEYFHNRGFSDDTMRAFGLGYSLQSWDGLMKRAQNEGMNNDVLLKAGLIRAREDGSSYDYFRGRAMFPIFSVTGRVIGFGARKIRDDDAVAGKYINSPETPIYNKSRVLFGLFHSKDAVRGEECALLVEGYADLISLYQSGIQNVVASSGTALTEEQLQLVARYAKKLVVVYDADTAGSDATLRGVDLALEQGFDVQIVRLPQGEDPDTYIRKFGAKEFRSLVSKTISFIEFKAERFREEGGFSTPERKTEAVRSIVQSIAKMSDELKRNFYVKEVAQKYDIYESVIYKELERWIAQDKRTTRRERALARPSEVGATISNQSTAFDTKVAPPEERDILKLLMEGNQDIVDYILSNVALAEFADAHVRQVAKLVLEHRQHGNYTGVETLVHLINDPILKDLITTVSLSKYELSRRWQTAEKEVLEGDPWQIAKDAILAIKRRAIQKDLEENQKHLQEANKEGRDSMPFLQRHQELLRQLKGLDVAAARKVEDV